MQVQHALAEVIDPREQRRARIDELAPPREEPHRLVGFVVGMSRSGTTWLARSLNQHPDIAAFGESSYWSRKYVAPGADGEYGEEKREELVETLHRKGSLSSLMADEDGCLAHLSTDDWPAVVDTILEHTELPVRPGELFHELCDAVGRIEGKPFVVEKTPHHVNSIDRILEEIPEARFVVTWRDAYGFALSYKHQGDRRDEKGRAGFEQLYHPIGVALIWRGYARSVLRARAYHPGNVLLVSHAGSRSDPTHELARVQRFFGVEPVPLRGPDRNSSFPSAGPRPTLAPEDVFWLNVLCRREMRALNLRPQRTPFAPWRIFRSLATLPSWAASVPGMLRGSGNRSPLRYLMRWLRR